jgi:hypothetical protein
MAGRAADEMDNLQCGPVTGHQQGQSSAVHLFLWRFANAFTGRQRYGTGSAPLFRTRNRKPF